MFGFIKSLAATAATVAVIIVTANIVQDYMDERKANKKAASEAAIFIAGIKRGLLPSFYSTKPFLHRSIFFFIF